ncbi:MAG TPA: hypothetical protein PLX46_02680 [Thiobacillaceae bacterium]|nr:hypothetical protein [Thiobacillaceae bacterium]
MATDATIAGWTVLADPEHTRATYSEMSMGGSQKCGCDGCRNFQLVRNSAFPPEVIQFFEVAGIDITKDAEVYEYGEIAPGIHSYGGEYYFLGKIIKQPSGEVSLQPGFRFVLTTPSPLMPPNFRGEESLCFLFEAELPWVIGNGSHA